MDVAQLCCASASHHAIYQLPEGKSFLIGSLGTGAQVGGVLGAAGGGTATLLGAGTDLVGFPTGDVNIHANAAGDAQTLSLLVRSTSDTLVLGNASTPVVLTPTWGDSGASSAITMLRDRTGSNTLFKIGAGTLAINNVQFTSVGGAANDRRDKFVWQVNAGTLSYNQNDGAGANYAAFNVNTGGTLGGTGVINSAVIVNSGGTVAPGNSPGILTIAGDFSITNGATLKLEINGLTEGTDYDQLKLTAGTTVVSNSTLSLTWGTFTPDQVNTNYIWIVNHTGGGSTLGQFAGLADDTLVTNVNGAAWYITYDANYASGLDGGNDIVLYGVIPEPSALALVGCGLLLLIATQRRRRD